MMFDFKKMNFLMLYHIFKIKLNLHTTIRLRVTILIGLYILSQPWLLKCI